MKLEKIKFTIIIPTRERCDVLKWSLSSVVAQKYQNLEIIVSDNASNDRTQEVVKSFNDSRIRYINTKTRVSMSENWEFALSHVNDACWISIIGDDDAILPGALNKVAELIKETKVSAIRSDICLFIWPQNKNISGTISIPTKKGWEKRNSVQWLKKVMLSQADYTKLPMLYNGGFVDFDVLKKIKAKTGRFYNSCIPDVYSACAIASIVNEYVYSYEPYAINGASKHSSGADAFTKNKKAKDSPSIIFKNEPNLPFHKDIPTNEDGSYPLSIHAILYESYLQTKQLRSISEFENHQLQLTIILARKEKAHADSVKKWGMNFAIIHGLDFEKINKASILFQMKIIYYKLTKLLSRTRYLVYSDLLNNSYEASLFAARILNKQKTFNITEK